MKKQMKKLSLNRETLRDLDEGKLEKVYGASLVRSFCANCNTYTTCGTTAC